MNFEPIKYDYTLEEDRAPVARTPTPPRTASSSHRRKRSSTAKQRQPTSILKANEQILPNKEKAKEPKILFDNEKVELDLSLEETKELLKRQIRGGVDEKRKLLPEEFRLIQQSPFYRPDQSKKIHCNRVSSVFNGNSRGKLILHQRNLFIAAKL